MTTEELFDLVAPIAIYHGADVCYKKKALAALRILRKADWTGRKPLPSTHLDELNDWARELYDELFENIVEENGPEELEQGYDYWGAKGYKLPHQGSKNFELSGDSSMQYPWYADAATLIERVKSIHVHS